MSHNGEIISRYCGTTVVQSVMENVRMSNLVFMITAAGFLAGLQS